MAEECLDLFVDDVGCVNELLRVWTGHDPCFGNGVWRKSSLAQEFGECKLVARIGIDRAQRCLAGREVVGMTRIDAVVATFSRLGEHAIGLLHANDCTDFSTQREISNDGTIGKAEEVEFVHPEHICSGCLFTSTNSGHLVSRDCVVTPASLSVGDEAVHDFVAFADPARDRAACTEVHIVGMSRDHQDLHGSTLRRALVHGRAEVAISHRVVEMLMSLRAFVSYLRGHRAIAGTAGVVLIAVVGFSALIGMPPFGFVVIIGGIALPTVVYVTRRERCDRPVSIANFMATLCVATLATFAAIQAIPYGRAHANPPVTQEPAWANDETRDLMVRACFGCHSNEVDYPAYASIAPISWVVQSHVDEGREKVNYSEFDRRQRDAHETLEVIAEGSMPPHYYTLFGLHPEAQLTEAEFSTLIAGIKATPGLTDHDD